MFLTQAGLDNAGQVNGIQWNGHNPNGCGLVVGENTARLRRSNQATQRVPDQKHAMGNGGRELFKSNYAIENKLLSLCCVFSRLYEKAETCENFEKRNEWSGSKARGTIADTG